MTLAWKTTKIRIFNQVHCVQNSYILLLLQLLFMLIKIQSDNDVLCFQVRKEDLVQWVQLRQEERQVIVVGGPAANTDVPHRGEDGGSEVHPQPQQQSPPGPAGLLPTPGEGGDDAQLLGAQTRGDGRRKAEGKVHSGWILSLNEVRIG